jgi:hypothetical protein
MNRYRLARLRNSVAAGIVATGAAICVLLPLTPGFAQTLEDAEIAAMDAETSSASAAQTPSAVNGGAVSLQIPQREEGDHRARNIFAAQSWVRPPPPPPPAAPPPPPPPPTAPPLPFVYVGSFQQDATTVYYLVRGDRAYDVKIGDLIDNTYRVDGIRNDQLMFTYLPLDERQLLPLGSSK